MLRLDRVVHCDEDSSCHQGHIVPIMRQAAKRRPDTGPRRARAWTLGCVGQRRWRDERSGFKVEPSDAKQRADSAGRRQRAAGWVRRGLGTGSPRAPTRDLGARTRETLGQGRRGHCLFAPSRLMPNPLACMARLTTGYVIIRDLKYGGQVLSKTITSRREIGHRHSYCRWAR